MRRCIQCRKYKIKKQNHDLCRDCWDKLCERDEKLFSNEHFKHNLFADKNPTVYVMFYGEKEKIGYTNDLDSRLIEMNRKFPNNKLVYFREFITESEARRFEAWLKGLKKRDLIKAISEFQDKIKKIEFV